jgi:hypothetical protein
LRSGATRALGLTLSLIACARRPAAPPPAVTFTRDITLSEHPARAVDGPVVSLAQIATGLAQTAPPCKCGRSGDLESVCSLTAIR